MIWMYMYPSKSMNNLRLDAIFSMIGLVFLVSYYLKIYS